MIQLNNLTVSGTNSSAAASAGSPNTQSSLNSFETALSDALAATLEKFGIDPNAVKISIGPATSGPATPAPGTSAAPVTNGSAGTTGTTTTAPTMPSYDPFLQAAFENSPAPATSTPDLLSSPSVSTAGSTPDSTQSFDDAYWSKQPAAVQQLRTVEDMGQRVSMARELAVQGYTIDVPIMVWHWDPSLTTSLRQSAGYTWVPSALQANVEIAPGLGAMPGLTPYDPKHPPAGSITV